MSAVSCPILNGNEQLFASKYKLLLPNEDKSRAELDRFSSGSWVKRGKRRLFLCLILIGGLSVSVGYAMAAGECILYGLQYFPDLGDSEHVCRGSG